MRKVPRRQHNRTLKSGKVTNVTKHTMNVNNQPVYPRLTKTQQKELKESMKKTKDLIEKSEKERYDTSGKFSNIKKVEIKEINNSYEQSFDRLDKDIDERGNDPLDWIERWTLNKRSKYAGTREERKEKIRKALVEKRDKDIKQKLREISEIENAEDFKEPLILTIEWTKSRTWGSNPKGYDNRGNEIKGISGAGYDKLSTATAGLLNQNKDVLKELYKVKNKALSKNPDISSRDALSYGSGYGVRPKFEGGVGLSSHRNIIEKAGLKFNHITSTKNTDVIMITK